MLDRVASERVLSNLRQCLPSRRPQLLAELRALAAEGVLTSTSGLADWPHALAMDPADFYGIRGASFTALRRELGWLSDAPHPGEERLSRAIGSALLHGDDPDRLRALGSSAAGAAHPGRTRAACVVDAHRPAVWRQELRLLLELLVCCPRNTRAKTLNLFQD